MKYLISYSIFPFSIIVFAAALAANQAPKVWNPSNLTEITWAHAVNSKAELQKAFDDGVDMIECDIVYGLLHGDDPGNEQPIMGHPPVNTSDISLEEFLNKIMEFNSNIEEKRGVKLDFKSTQVFQESTKILEALWEKMNYPVWINADILPGPVNNTNTVPVDADIFLQACKKFPNAVLSIGWTTRWGILGVNKGSYMESHIDDMLNAIKRNDVKHSLTFPVRAGIAANSNKELVRLYSSLNETNAVTFTIWSGTTDYVNAKNLEDLIFELGLNNVYLDVPNELSRRLDLTARSSGTRITYMNWINLAIIVFFIYNLFI